jgi:hypothetical protein
LRLGKKKLEKNELQKEWDNYEAQRKEKIAKVLEVSILNFRRGKSC